MKITAERFNALLNGTATDVTGEEMLIRVEAFKAERCGEDPASAVQSRMSNVSIVQTIPTTMPRRSPATNTNRRSELASSANKSDVGKHRLYLLGLIGAAAVVSWFAVSTGMGSLVAHFIGVAIFGLCMQGVVWFFRAPVNRSRGEARSQTVPRWLNRRCLAEEQLT